MKEKTKESKEETWHRRSPELKKGKYSDGHPLHDLQYLETKIILKRDRFTSVDSFNQFAKVVKRAAENADVDFSRKGFKEERMQTPLSPTRGRRPCLFPFRMLPVSRGSQNPCLSTFVCGCPLSGCLRRFTLGTRDFGKEKVNQW